jgi:filamentous hemagglutinin family protein
LAASGEGFLNNGMVKMNRKILLILLMGCTSGSHALPVGGVVSAGGISINNGAGSTTITQSTQNAAINWQGFNIGTSEVVKFVQPDANSVVLNRVLGADPSVIIGKLSANGKVFLLNPNGILFGKSAQINVGGLLASTLNITDSNFMAGRYQFTDAGIGTVLNQGEISINAEGGYVALLGAAVSNEGIISARLGTVALAAGTAMTLDLAGDGLLNVLVTQGRVNALIQNSGLIRADGGQVLLTTQAAGELMHSAVNNTGVIEAQSIENRNGTIRLLADMQSGSVNVAGTLTAQGGTNAGDGGLIETSASHVMIADGVVINTLAPRGKAGVWLLDPVNYTIAVTGGDETPAKVTASLATSNRLITASNDITVADAVTLATAQTLTLNAGHDVLINAPVTAVPAGAGLVLTAGNNVLVGAALTETAAGSSITISADHNVTTSAAILAVAGASTIKIDAGNDVLIGGAITGTAANSVIGISAARDVTVAAAITAVAANSIISFSAGRDLTTSPAAALLATAAGTVIDLSAGRNVSVNAAIAASAAGSSIKLISGTAGIGPGASGGTVSIGAAVASLNTTIRFNPNGYINTRPEIAAYVAKVTGMVDAKAWLFAGADNKNYDGTNNATLSLKGNPGAGGEVTMTPGSATFDSRNAGIGKTVNFSGTTISGTDAGQFALFAAAGTTTADIAERVLTLTSANKIYDGITKAITIGDNRIAGDVLTVSNVTAGFANKNVCNAQTVSVGGLTLTGRDAANYSNTIALATAANITPAPLTVTASNAAKTYGQSPALIAYSASGLVNGEVIGSVTETSPGTVSTAGVAGSPYTITPSGSTGGTFSASNYTLNYVNGLLTVMPASLKVTVANATKVYGQTMILTAFTMAGLVNGETLGAFTETSPGTAANASVAGSPYVITPGKAAGGTFNASNYAIVYVNGELTVTPLVQTLLLGVNRFSVPIEDAATTPFIVPEKLPDELLAVGNRSGEE